MPPTRLLSVGLCAALLAAAAPASADAYDDAFAAAAAAERQGRLDLATQALAAVLPQYPQDYALPLQLAWLSFRAGQFGLAERYYRVAEAVSPAAREARLGLAASLERQGRCDAARPVYSVLARERPDLPEGAAGVARCAPTPSLRATLDVSALGTYFAEHLQKSTALGGALGGSVALPSGLFVAGTYRYLRLTPPSSALYGAWGQQEGHVSVGVSRASWGVSAQAAYIADGSGALGDSEHLGLTLRASPWGDVEVSGSVSVYDDLTVLRVEPSFRVPLGLGVSLRPAVALQSADGEGRVTGMLTASLDRPGLSLWVGGKYGDEVRPAYLGSAVVYDIAEEIAYGAWMGVSVNATDATRIHLSYAMDRLHPESGDATTAHSLTLGLTLSF